jgi:hypothetical protein
VKWRDHASSFYTRVRCKLSHITRRTGFIVQLAIKIYFSNKVCLTIRKITIKIRVFLRYQLQPLKPDPLKKTPVSKSCINSGVRVTRSLVLYVCFVDRCLSFCTFSFGHCVVCSSSIYGFWLPLWYLQTLLWTLNTWQI